MLKYKQIWHGIKPTRWLIKFNLTVRNDGTNLLSMICKIGKGRRNGNYDYEFLSKGVGSFISHKWVGVKKMLSLVFISLANLFSVHTCKGCES